MPTVNIPGYKTYFMARLFSKPGSGSLHYTCPSFFNVLGGDEHYSGGNGDIDTIHEVPEVVLVQLHEPPTQRLDMTGMQRLCVHGPSTRKQSLNHQLPIANLISIIIIQRL